LFEPVHGSAPKYAGKGTANPMATVLTGGLMLEQLGLRKAGERLTQAVRSVLADGLRPQDLGGKATTREVARAMEAALS
jgi:isocitrate/isopropylmalate dehydrogenase